MRKRTVKKLLRNPERLRGYGRDRASGSKRRRRGRRAILRQMPWNRDRSSLPVRQRLDLLERDLEREMNR